MLDLWTDLSMCVVFYYQDLYQLSIWSAVFLFIPYCMSVCVTVYFIIDWSVWKHIQDHPSRLKNYLSKYRFILILFSLFGGFYATVDLFRSKILFKYNVFTIKKK